MVHKPYDAPEQSYTSTSANASEMISNSEQMAVWILLSLIMLLRIVFVFRYRFDLDEPQHLHVVWGWAHGLLQYRDVFDNHAPLFHMLSAPLFSAFGESPNLLFIMRLAMVPLYAAVLWCTFLIGREIYSYRAGLWAAVFTGLYPFNFLCSTEYRTDDLWTVYWLFAVTILIRKQLRPMRCFYAGVFLGAAMGTSMKTSLMLFTLMLSALAVIVLFYNRYRSYTSVTHLAHCAAALLAGLAIIPLLLTLFFYSKGALAPFFYQAIRFNMLPNMARRPKLYLRGPIFPVSLALLCLIARSMIRHSSAPRQSTRRVFVLFAGGIYIAGLEAFWPLLQGEHFLPFYPLFFVIVTPLILKLVSIPQPGCLGTSPDLRRLYACAVFAFFIVLEIGSILGLAHGAPWKDNTRHQIELLDDVLRLTSPNDFVADLRGETVFRPRSSYYVLETITRKRIKRGLLPDDIPERLIATRTCVATLDDNRFPNRARAFLNSNYVSVGRLRVAGQLLPEPSGSISYIHFDIRIPARYVIVSHDCAPSGLLDNIPCDGERFLEAGHHVFQPAFPQCSYALLWGKAYALGFSPFIQRN